jgi:threonine synthase
MSDAVAPHLTEPYGPRTTSCATELSCRDCGYRTPLLDTAFKCPACGEGLDVDYDYERAKAAIAERGLEGRPWNIWRFEELLPIVSRRAQQNAANPC